MNTLRVALKALRSFLSELTSRRSRALWKALFSLKSSHDDGTALVSSEFRFRTVPAMFYPDYTVDEEVVRAGVLISQGRWNEATLLANRLLAADPQ